MHVLFGLNQVLFIEKTDVIQYMWDHKQALNNLTMIAKKKKKKNPNNYALEKSTDNGGPI